MNGTFPFCPLYFFINVFLLVLVLSALDADFTKARLRGEL